LRGATDLLYWNCNGGLEGKKERRVMTLRGTVVNGGIVLDKPLQVPEGTRVQVTVWEESHVDGESKQALAGLLKYAGCMNDLPADFAEQHDHYIHGTPKR